MEGESLGMMTILTYVLTKRSHRNSNKSPGKPAIGEANLKADLPANIKKVKAQAVASSIEPPNLSENTKP